MALIVSLVIWTGLGVGVFGLVVWWWLGVHRKPREEQASRIIAANLSRQERRRTDFFGDVMPPADGSHGEGAGGGNA